MPHIGFVVVLIWHFFLLRLTCICSMGDLLPDEISIDFYVIYVSEKHKPLVITASMNNTFIFNHLLFVSHPLHPFNSMLLVLCMLWSSFVIYSFLNRSLLIILSRLGPQKKSHLTLTDRQRHTHRPTDLSLPWFHSCQLYYAKQVEK